MVTAYTYDDASRLTSLANQSGSTVLNSFAYAYNAVNNRTSVTYASGLGDVYGYDATDQLTAVQYGAANPAGTPASPQSTQAYVYDAVGNRTSVTQNGTATAYGANALNEYTQVGSTAQTSDANGNVIGPVNGFTCAYDAQNRLVSMSRSIPGGRGQPPAITTYAFAYDARNRCVQRTASLPGGVQTDTTTDLVYDGWNLVAEFDADSGSQTASYVHGAAVDEVLARTDANGTVYYHHDALGSTVALTGSGGQLVEQYGYDVYGQPAIKDATGAVLGGSGYGNRFVFTRREWLTGEGVYDYRNRVYSPALGRFLQTDPIDFGGGDINLYRYVKHNVLNFSDPEGLQAPIGSPGYGFPGSNINPYANYDPHNPYLGSDPNGPMNYANGQLQSLCRAGAYTIGAGAAAAAVAGAASGIDEIGGLAAVGVTYLPAAAAALGRWMSSWANTNPPPFFTNPPSQWPTLNWGPASTPAPHPSR